jgi:hypothetical protein
VCLFIFSTSFAVLLQRCQFGSRQIHARRAQEGRRLAAARGPHALQPPQSALDGHRRDRHFAQRVHIRPTRGKSRLGSCFQPVLFNLFTPIQIDEANKKIKRAQPLPEDLSEVEAALKQNTVYVKGFPETLTLDELIAFFEQYGKVSKIFMRRFPTTKAFKGKVFVTFGTAEDVKKLLDVTELKYNDTKLETETQ